MKKGVPMAGIIRCSKGHENIEGDNFCRFCGERIGVVETPPPIAGMLWQRGANDFVTRIDTDDLQGILKKGIIIEQSTKALLFINGTLAETLYPGKYDLGGLTGILRPFEPFRTVTALLVDSGDIEFPFTVTDVYTNDPLKIGVSCKIIIQIENPVVFLNNVMKGRKNYLIGEIRGALYDELQNALNETVGKKSLIDLNWDLSLKQQFEVQVENHLRTTFQRMGLSLIQLRTIDYRFQAFDKIRGVYEEIYLQVSEEEALLQKRKRLFDLYDHNQIQGIIEDTKELEYREQRQKVWANMRRLVNSDKMDDVKSADDLEAFIHEMDKGKILRDEEVKDLANTFAQSGLRRDFLLSKMQLEQGLEAQRIQMLGAAENDLAEWEIRARKEREELDMSLEGLERVKKIKTQEKREETDIEIERVGRLTQLGVEALIHASGVEQAQILADLKKTEILKDLPDEKILALGAKDSPELAKAFQEKFRGFSSDLQKKMYEEMMEQKDQSMRILLEMFNKR
ncbi:MAG: hypothetical protein C0392_10220 [Syntrophus sp. (in: bacteria)]|nr:hypothetical protein [Syntrophus sp. (in: bacteria)]